MPIKVHFGVGFGNLSYIRTNLKLKNNMGNQIITQGDIDKFMSLVKIAVTQGVEKDIKTYTSTSSPDGYYISLEISCKIPEESIIQIPGIIIDKKPTSKPNRGLKSYDSDMEPF